MLEICWKFSCHAAQYYKQTIMCRVIFRSCDGLVANGKDSDFMSTWHLPLNYKPGVSGLHMRGLWFIIHDQIIYRWLFYVQLPFKVCFCYFIKLAGGWSSFLHWYQSVLTSETKPGVHYQRGIVKVKRFSKKVHVSSIASLTLTEVTFDATR